MYPNTKPTVASDAATGMPIISIAKKATTIRIA
jgi:hypothetical protein